MGEEEKKPAAEQKKPEEAKKAEEGKKEEEKPQEKAAEEKKEEKPEESKEAKETKEEAAPPPPQEIILKVYMHCEGCARKVRRCLKGFPGVEDVITDCKIHKVVVKGEKADPLKVLERVQRKSHRLKVELLSPIPKPPSEEEKKPEEEKPKPEEKKEEPQVITVVLKVHMHCEACAQEIKKRILRMKGVESAEPDLKSSQVIVKGVFDPAKLVEYVYKRTGKHGVIVKQEPEKKEEKAEEGKKEEEKKGEEGGGKENKAVEEENKEKKEGGGGGDKEEAKPAAAEAPAPAPAEATTEETKMVELKKNEFYYYSYPQTFAMDRYAVEAYQYHGYAPQLFSDENPNACSVM